MKTRIFAIAAICVMLVGAMAIIPNADAERKGTDPTADDNVLYFHVINGEAENYYWMSNAKNEPDQNFVGGVGSGYGVPVVGVPLPMPMYGELSVSIPLEPALVNSIALDTSKQIIINVYASCSLMAYNVEFTTELAAGSTTIAQGEAQTVTLSGNPAGDLTYTLISWSVNPSTSEIPAGANLTWTITAYSDFADSVWIGTGSDASWSNIVLPVIDTIAPEEENNESNETGNTTGNVSDDLGQDMTNGSEKTPGFEFIGLACAVGVAVFLIRRKR